MKVLVIGANGNTGTRIVQRLLEGPHDPVAMVRSAEQRGKFDVMGAPTVLADLEYPIDHAVQGCDAVVFAAAADRLRKEIQAPITKVDAEKLAEVLEPVHSQMPGQDLEDANQEGRRLSLGAILDRATATFRD